MASPTGYRISGYGGMITSRARMDPYDAALRAAVKPGSVVVDIGAGTGIFSLIACQLGAREVHAIDPHPSIEIAARAARDNGFATRMVCHAKLSSAVELAERADVLVSDIRGPMPLLQHHIATIRDARARLIKPDAAIIPRRDLLYAALVDDPDYATHLSMPWLSNRYGLDLSSAHPHVANDWVRSETPDTALLTEPQHWATLDYRTIEDPNVSAKLSFRPERPGTANGLLLWFDTELGDGIGFSNAPGQPRQIYGRMFCPLERPVPLTTASRVEISLSATLMDDMYIWTWNTRAFDRAEDTAPAARFRQSSFKAMLQVGEVLARRDPQAVPALGPDAAVDQACLALADGTATLAEIAASLSERFPERFKDEAEALGHAADLFERYRP